MYKARCISKWNAGSTQCQRSTTQHRDMTPKPQREKQDRFHHHYLLSINTPAHTKQIGKTISQGSVENCFILKQSQSREGETEDSKYVVLQVVRSLMLLSQMLLKARKLVLSCIPSLAWATATMTSSISTTNWLTLLLQKPKSTHTAACSVAAKAQNQPSGQHVQNKC